MATSDETYQRVRTLEKLDKSGAVRAAVSIAS